MLADEYAAECGLLQSLDPRFKLVTFAALIVAVMFLKDSFLVLAVYLLCVALAVFSRIPVIFFFQRTWIFIPLFSLFIALPSLFSTFTPGEALTVIHVGNAGWVITRQGAAAAVLFVSRVLVSVSLAVVLTMTTRATELFAGLRWLGIPSIFVMTLGMCYRYIFLFVGIVQDMFLGIKSRTGGAICYRRGQKIAAWNMAMLWQKSLQMNQEVYNAMLSRGYTGEPRVLYRFRARPVDWVWVGFTIVILSGLVAAAVRGG